MAVTSEEVDHIFASVDFRNSRRDLSLKSNPALSIFSSLTFTGPAQILNVISTRKDFL